jgi:hypothetical protein
LVDETVVLGEVGWVEQSEARGVRIGERVPVDEDLRLVPSVSRVERPEAGGIGIAHLEGLAGEGIEVVRLAVADVISGMFRVQPNSIAKTSRHTAAVDLTFAASPMSLLGPRRH